MVSRQHNQQPITRRTLSLQIGAMSTPRRNMRRQVQRLASLLSLALFLLEFSFAQVSKSFTAEPRVASFHFVESKVKHWPG